MKDKDIEGIAEELFREEDTIIAVPAPTPRTRSAEEICEYLPGTTEPAADVVAGLERAKELAQPGDIIVVCGSLYCLGDARRYLRQKTLH